MFLLLRDFQSVDFLFLFLRPNFIYFVHSLGHFTYILYIYFMYVYYTFLFIVYL